MRRRLFLVIVLTLSGCYGSHTRDPRPIPEPPRDAGWTRDAGWIANDGGSIVDADGDGYPAGVDCDDHDATIHPGATEYACGLDGIDQNCDGFDYDEACEADPDCLEWLCNG